MVHPCILIRTLQWLFAVFLNYLKLFGFLNAVYLQIGSILKLVEIIKLPNKRKIEKTFKGHDLICARNMLVSHTLDYLEEGSLNSFTIQQCSIGGHGVKFMNNKTRDLITFNFDDMFVSWKNETKNILILIIKKFLKVYINHVQKKSNIMKSNLMD